MAPAGAGGCGASLGARCELPSRGRHSGLRIARDIPKPDASLRPSPRASKAPPDSRAMSPGAPSTSSASERAETLRRAGASTAPRSRRVSFIALAADSATGSNLRAWSHAARIELAYLVWIEHRQGVEGE